MSVHIRWMIRRDMPEVLHIENDSFEHPWSEEDFITSLRQRNCIGMVAEVNEKVVGYMVYELHRNKLYLINLAVHKDYRRKGIGKTMVDKLYNKLSEQRRNRIALEVRERNLDAQLFLRSVGFSATRIEWGFYEYKNEYGEIEVEDAYHMVRRFERECGYSVAV